MAEGHTPNNQNSAVHEAHHSDSGISKPPPPPPPYEPRANEPVILAETTTTRTEVVTTTTTHFFSLPLWRKRSAPIQKSTRQNGLDVNVRADEHGLISASTRSSTYMIEKDLPPIPQSEQEAVSDIFHRPSPSEETPRRRVSSTSSFSPDLRKPYKPSELPAIQPTAALARAALGLGLPHVLPHTPASSSSSEVNTIKFVPQDAHTQDSHVPSPRVRRAKSAHRLIPNFLSDRSDVSPEEDHSRRTRGFSFGSTSFLDFNTFDVKGKNKETNVDQLQAPPRSISRRASFWSRKRTIPLDSHPAPQDTPKHYLNPLPIFQPVSPFNMEITVTPSSPPYDIKYPPSQHSRGLSRSHSERARIRTSEMTPSYISDTLRTTKGPTISEFPAYMSDKSNNHTQSQPSETSLQLSRPRASTNPPELHNKTRPLSSSLVSPRKSSISDSRPESHNGSANVPPPLVDKESPEVYLHRLQLAVSKAEVAGILASSTDTFYVHALQTYVKQFDFVDDPLDVALRKLLMEVGLPQETQQIDRVMEAFAGRYLQCNPTLFTSEDHPYILAFSLIMLHTDAFNKSNKRKMTKADYIKNTKLPGVAPEVLDCFYDNILSAPFIFIEDPVDVNGQRRLTPETASSRIMTPTGTTMGSPNPAPMKGNKVDPYYLITNNLLGPLRVNVEAYVPSENPYSYEGTMGPWDEAQLQRVFAKASEIEVEAQRRASPLFNLVDGGISPNLITNSGPSTQTSSHIWTLKVTKVGHLNRKDDVMQGGKKASNRKWKLWSVILTGSQLLFFRDPSWSTSLLTQSGSHEGRVIYPQSTEFKPDELLSVKDAIAVFDKSYTKYENTLRFILPDGRQLLLQAPDEKELNEWISRINYASAFKSAGVRMRPLEMSGIDVKLTGIAAATSHLHDLQHGSPMTHSWDDNAPHDLMDMLSVDSDSEAKRSPAKATMTELTSLDDINVPVAPEIDGADQFKATFDQVKADLAAGRWTSSEDLDQPSVQGSPEHYTETTPVSLIPSQSAHSRLPSRSQIMRSKIEDLDSKIKTAQSQLDSDMRFARNIATLTPFQKLTRDRLTTAVQSIAKRIMQVRLETTKLTCHRYVLLSDLASQERSWNQAKAVALQAAAETLRARHPEDLPRMKLSFHDEPSRMTSPTSTLHLDTLSPSCRPESSICDSFHSAVDFGLEWPSYEDTTTSGFLDASRFFESPTRSNSRSSSFSINLNTESGYPKTSPLVSSQSTQPYSGYPSPRTSGDFQSHEKFYSAYETLEDRTEAQNEVSSTQRVSLVRLPSNIQISTRFRRDNDITST